MDFTAKVIQKFDLESGTSRMGNPWSKQCWLLETPGQYPRKVKVDAMGRAVENVQMEVGRTYKVYVDLESREFNGRYYTDVRVYRADEVTPDQSADAAFGGAPAAAPAAPAAPASPFGAPEGFPPAPEAPASFTDPSDDLPF